MNMKQHWEGELLAIQPRIRLLRSFDQRSHRYLGYVLYVRGTLNDEARSFKVAIGNTAHEKHQLQAGDRVSGEAVPVADEQLESAALYKASKLKVLGRTNKQQRSHRHLEVYRLL